MLIALLCDTTEASIGAIKPCCVALLVYVRWCWHCVAAGKTDQGVAGKNMYGSIIDTREVDMAWHCREQDKEQAQLTYFYCLRYQVNAVEVMTQNTANNKAAERRKCRRVLDKTLQSIYSWHRSHLLFPGAEELHP